MGVDFMMQVVRRSPEGRLEEVDGERFRFAERLFFLSELFKPEFEGVRIGERLRSLLPRPVSFRWFDEAYNSMDGTLGEPDLKNCWPPEEILDSLEAVRGTLSHHEAEFSPYYYLEKAKGQRRGGGYKIFLQGRPYVVRGGWARAVAVPDLEEGGSRVHAGAETIDLSGTREIRCRTMFIGKLPTGEWGEVLGPEITVFIKKESCFEHFRKCLEAMMAVCTTAREGGNSVFTYIS